MYLTNLYPRPEFIRETEEVRYTFGSRVTAYLSVPDASAGMIGRMKYLWNCFSKTASVLDVRPITGAGHSCSLYIGEPPVPGNTPEHYEIRSDGRGVLLNAVSTKALMDGFT